MNGWIGADVEDLALFALVVEHGGFTAAARRTGVPQSTLSRRIVGLETRLGAKLLDRTTRSVGLTEIGRRTHAHVRLMLAEAEAAREAIEVLTAAPHGLLRVSAPVLLTRSRLPLVITRFLHAHREVSVALEWTTRSLDPVEDDVDVVVRVDVPPQSRAVVDTLFHSRLGIYLPPSFRGPLPETPDALAGQELFGVARGSTAQTLTFHRDGAVRTVPVSLRLRTNDVRPVLEAAEACGTYALLPDFAVPDGWTAAWADWALPSAAIIALTTRHGRKLPRVAAFIEVCAAAFGTGEPQDR